MNNTKNAVALLFSNPYRRAYAQNEFYEQELICHRQAERTNLRIVGTYKDRTRNFKLQNRPVLEACVKYATNKKNNVSVFLVTDTESLSRDPNEAEIITLTLQNNGVKVVIAEA